MNPADLTTTLVLVALAMGLTLIAWRQRRAEADVAGDDQQEGPRPAGTPIRRPRMIAIGTIVVAGAAALAWKLGYADDMLDTSHGAIRICENQVLGQLQAPSTYKRIAASYTRAGPLTRDKFERYQKTSFCPYGNVWVPCTHANDLTLFLDAKVLLNRQGIRRPTRKQTAKALKDSMDESYAAYERRPAEKQQTAFVQIDYDAANAYGTPLRSVQICRFGPKSGDSFAGGDMFGDSAN